MVEYFPNESKQSQFLYQPVNAALNYGRFPMRQAAQVHDVTELIKQGVAQSRASCDEPPHKVYLFSYTLHRFCLKVSNLHLQ